MPNSSLPTMKTTEVQATFTALVDTFEPIVGQPTDEDLTRLNLANLSQIVPIPFDRQLGIHNLMGILLADDEYKKRQGTVFPAYKRPPNLQHGHSTYSFARRVSRVGVHSQGKD